MKPVRIYDEIQTQSCDIGKPVIIRGTLFSIFETVTEVKLSSAPVVKMFIKSPDHTRIETEDEIIQTISFGYGVDNNNGDTPDGRNYTREDIVRILDNEIEATAARWGENNFYTTCAKNHKQKLLAEYDEGKIIPVETETYIENATEYETVFMSDGSVQTVNYGYID